MVFGSQDIWEVQTHLLSVCRKGGLPWAFTFLTNFAVSGDPNLASVRNTKHPIDKAWKFASSSPTTLLVWGTRHS